MNSLWLLISGIAAMVLGQRIQSELLVSKLRNGDRLKAALRVAATVFWTGGILGTVLAGYAGFLGPVSVGSVTIHRFNPAVAQFIVGNTASVDIKKPQPFRSARAQALEYARRKAIITGMPEIKVEADPETFKLTYSILSFNYTVHNEGDKALSYLVLELVPPEKSENPFQLQLNGPFNPKTSTQVAAPVPVGIKKSYHDAAVARMPYCVVDAGY